MTSTPSFTSNAISSNVFFNESRIIGALPLVTTSWRLALRISFYLPLPLSTFNLPTTPNIPLLMPLTGDGVSGDDWLEGNEEARIYRDFKVTINQLRHAVRLKGKMEEQRVSLDLRKDAKVALSNWLADKIDKTIFKELSTDPTSDRIVYGGSATGEGTIGASDTFSTALIVRAKRIALADENKLTRDFICAKLIVLAINRTLEARAKTFSIILIVSACTVKHLRRRFFYD